MPERDDIIGPGNAGYPPRLLDLPDPPMLLHVIGEVPAGPAVAVVGSRDADAEGTGFAATLAAGLARQGVTVVSGGARGIDQAAHGGALEAGGRTVIVLGCGVEVDYPAGTMGLRQRAARAGAVVSELPPDAPPRPGHFPRRNRIVAALAEAVVVVRAGLRSGALSTARHAEALGRPVLAVPGAPGAELCRGTHGLIRGGALLAEGVDDVLAAIGRRRAPRAEPSPAPALEGLAAAVHAALAAAPASADELARGLDRPVAEVLGVLVELELSGLVSCRGGCYERPRE